LSGFALPQLSILFTPTAHVVHGEQTFSFPLFGFDGKDGPSGMNREPGINNTRAEPPYPFKSEWFRSRPHNPYFFKLTPYYHLRVFSFNRTERWAGVWWFTTWELHKSYRDPEEMARKGDYTMPMCNSSPTGYG
ncbi:hypothetical protein AMTR_s00172p00074130, partial [Amborella trichopoda]